MNNNELQHPYISHIFWGHMEVDGVREGKDFKKLGAKGVPVILVGDKHLNGFSVML